MFNPRAPKSAIAMVLVLLAIAVWQVTGIRHQRNPTAIELALKRMPFIKVGMREGAVFKFLELPKPNEEMDSFIEGRTGSTWTRYDLGFDGRYVMECESFNPRDNDLLSFDDGILLSVKICQVETSNEGKVVYKLLEPSWRDLTTQNVRELKPRTGEK